MRTVRALLVLSVVQFGVQGEERITDDAVIVEGALSGINKISTGHRHFRDVYKERKCDNVCATRERIFTLRMRAVLVIVSKRHTWMPKSLINNARGSESWSAIQSVFHVIKSWSFVVFFGALRDTLFNQQKKILRGRWIQF